MNAELNPRHEDLKKSKRRRYRVINGRVIRYTKYGHPFLYEMHKNGIKGLLTEEEKQMAKSEWKNIQSSLPDQDTFDPVYVRSSKLQWKIEIFVRIFWPVAIFL